MKEYKNRIADKQLKLKLEAWNKDLWKMSVSNK